MVGRGIAPASLRVPLLTKDGLALLSAQPSYPYLCNRDIPASPRFDLVVNTTIVPLAAPFFQYLPNGSVPSDSSVYCLLTNDDFQSALGLGYPFVKAYVAHTLAPGRSVIVVPAAVGGQSIDQFSPDLRGAQLWARMMSATKAALQHRPPGVSPRPLDNRVAALLWLQGESDMSSKTDLQYTAALRRMVAAFRANASDARIPFVAGQLLQHSFSGFTRRSNVQRALSRVALGAVQDTAGFGGIANSALVSSAGLVSMGYHRLDTPALAVNTELQAHFDEDSQEQYGLRFYAAFRSLLATPSPSPPSSPRPTPGAPPVHACHWALNGSVPSPATGNNLFHHTDELDGGGPQHHLFLRAVTPAQWALPQAVLFYEVKLAQWDALRAFELGQPPTGPARALQAGLPVRTAATRSCACNVSASQLADAEGSTGWVAASNMACGYAFVDRPGLVDEAALSPNAALSFARAAAPTTVFTPFRFNNTYIVPLMRDGESVFSVSTVRATATRGATMAPGLEGVWLPLHQARSFPDVPARAAAEARGVYWVALIRGVAVVPELLPNNTVVAKRLPSQHTLAVRLPPPPAGARSPSQSATRSRTRSRSRTPKPKPV